MAAPFCSRQLADLGADVIKIGRPVVNRPQLKARGRWTEVQTPAGTVPALPPHNLLSAPPRMGRVPALGEHTAAVLAEPGLVELGLAELEGTP